MGIGSAFLRRSVALGMSLLAVASLTATTYVGAAERPKASKAKELKRRALSASQWAERIDRFIDTRLKEEGIPPSPRCNDAEFLRRVYLDLVGVIPSEEEARRFLDSRDPDKRRKLVDQLLADPRYGKHLADIWQAMLLPKVSDNRRLQREPMYQWLVKNFNANTPWNRMVYDLLTAAGPQSKNGAVSFWLGNRTPDKVTDTVSKLFLGVQLQCAQCHDHPFNSWKQDTYWGMAAFFVKVRPENPNRAAKNKKSPGVTESGKPRRRRRASPTAKNVPARFLTGEPAKLDQAKPFRPVFARWLTDPANPFFARAIVNRTWARLFGTGIVMPVDDMVGVNEPTHPELLQDLSEQFVASGFDLKHLTRAICNSATYQRTSKPITGNEEDDLLYSHMTIKVLTPEQLYDSLQQVVGKQTPKKSKGRKQRRRRGRSPRDAFVAFFRIKEEADPTVYEAGIPQALRLMNGPEFNRRSYLLDPKRLRDSKPADVIESLYLATLSRRPTDAEKDRLVDFVRDYQGKRSDAFADILWALLNSSEFTLNR